MAQHVRVDVFFNPRFLSVALYHFTNVAIVELPSLKRAKEISPAWSPFVPKAE